MTRKIAPFALLLALLSGCAVPSDPIPQADGVTAAQGEQPAPGVKAKHDPDVSTCDQARESFLTGTKADVVKALKALKADRSADGDAREYAGYWLVRDAGDADLRTMDQTIIVSLCS